MAKNAINYVHVCTRISTCYIVNSYTCAKSPITSTVGGIMSVYSGKLGYTDAKPMLTKPGSLQEKKREKEREREGGRGRERDREREIHKKRKKGEKEGGDMG